MCSLDNLQPVVLGVLQKSPNPAGKLFLPSDLLPGLDHENPPNLGGVLKSKKPTQAAFVAIYQKYCTAFNIAQSHMNDVAPGLCHGFSLCAYYFGSHGQLKQWYAICSDSYRRWEKDNFSQSSKNPDFECFWSPVLYFQDSSWVGHVTQPPVNVALGRDMDVWYGPLSAVPTFLGSLSACDSIIAELPKHTVCGFKINDTWYWDDPNADQLQTTDDALKCIGTYYAANAIGIWYVSQGTEQQWQIDLTADLPGRCQMLYLAARNGHFDVVNELLKVA